MPIEVNIPSPDSQGVISLVYSYSNIRKAHYLETVWQGGKPLVISYSLVGSGMDRNPDPSGSGFGIDEYKGAFVNIKKYDMLVPYFLSFDVSEIHVPFKAREEISSCPGHEPRHEDRYAQNQTCKFCPARRKFVTPEVDEKIYDVNKYGYSAWK